jgi:hypothetical protein
MRRNLGHSAPNTDTGEADALVAAVLAARNTE